MSARYRLHPGMTAVVTGAAGGLGSAICEALASRGVEVVAADIAGTETSLDVTDAAACRELARQVEPDVWVNNAGLLGAADLLEQGDEEIARVIAVNLLGVVNGTRAAAAVMASGSGGRILNIGSLASYNATPGLAIYSATKHGVLGYSVAAAVELRRAGVRVSCLCPDGIWTPMLRSVVGDESAAMPFSGRRLLEPDEVARAAIALMESRRLVASLPAGRAMLAKGSSLFPRLGMVAGPVAARLGAAGQARYRRRLQWEEIQNAPVKHPLGDKGSP
ncbi:MAG: SDR family NAD(P)-dependent oxidoreductase [Acidimicrobiales bacterium]